jgi:hypothetical protein
MEHRWVPSFELCSVLSFRVQEELRYGITCEGRNHLERQMKNRHSNYRTTADWGIPLLLHVGQPWSRAAECGRSVTATLCAECLES